MAMHKVKRAPFECPNCGAQVPGDALSCPECGSDDDTGWSEDTIYDGVDFPDPYGDEDPQESGGWTWIIIAGVLVIALVLVIAFTW